MSTNRVFVTRRLPEPALQLLRDGGLALSLWEEDRPIPRDELLARAPGHQALLTALTDRIDGEVMDAAGELKVIANWAVGYDNIDVPAATQRGIVVGNTPDVLTETSADLAFGLLLAVARRIVEGDRLVRAGGWSTWDPNLLLGRDVWGARLGIAGLGRIGQAMARRARGFGMDIVYWSREQKQAALEQELGVRYEPDFAALLEYSDVVSLHTALTPETRHLIGYDQLGRMRSTAILINTGRGGLVDQAALIDALRGGQIAGAGLDVTDPEPTPLGSPLLDTPNLVITPHIASATLATRTRMAELAARNVVDGLAGRPLEAAVNAGTIRMDAR